MINNFKELQNWELKTRDVIVVRRVYVDLAGGDLAAGMILSHLVYWNLPDDEGKIRLAIFRDGRPWLAVTNREWWDRCRLRPYEAAAAVKRLETAGLVTVAHFMFDSKKMTHLSLNEDAFIEALNKALTSPPLALPTEPRKYTRKEKESGEPKEFRTQIKSVTGSGLNQPPITKTTSMDYQEDGLSKKKDHRSKPENQEQPNQSYPHQQQAEKGHQAQSGGQLDIKLGIKKTRVRPTKGKEYENTPPELIDLFCQKSKVFRPEPGVTMGWGEYTDRWLKPLWLIYHHLCADNLDECGLLVTEAIKVLVDRPNPFNLDSPDSIRKTATSIKARWDREGRKGSQVIYR